MLRGRKAALAVLAFSLSTRPVIADEAFELPIGFPVPLSPVTQSGRDISYEMRIRYSDSAMFNPIAGEYEAVRLRTFQGNSTDPAAPFAGPRIDMRPGQTVRLKITNDLPEDPSCTGHHLPDFNLNTPHCFNTTNMHTHGFWISPSGNSDNVKLSIPPGTSFEHEYSIPEDHPAGTFFYHPHHHGSTALQVSSGLAGALIVHGDRLPQLKADGSISGGDLDTLLRMPDGAPMPERVILLQQVPYACRDEAGEIRTRDDETWWCADGDTGTIEQYDQFGQSTWDRSGRFNSLNGRIMPTFTKAEAGVPERWRVIHAGVRDTVKLRFRKVKEGGQSVRPDSQSALDRQAFVDEHCTGPTLPVLSVALDGLTRTHAVPQTDTILQPGYREDILVAFPDDGLYCVVDGEIPAEESVSGKVQERNLLGYVWVEGGDVVEGGVEAHLAEALVAAAETHMPGGARDKIVGDLKDGLKLSAFTKHADVRDAELTGKQTLGFRYHNVNLAPDPPRYQHEVGYLGQDIAGNMILTNAQPFDPDRIDRVLTLGDVEEWTLASFWGGHPFHIHVNPFQVVSIIDTVGNDVSAPGAGGQYAGLKGQWKDTLFIEEGYVFKVRSRYERYIGDFVLHCHILDHEDKGMMQNVRIVPPGG